MKKLFSVLLAMTLLFGAVSALAETTYLGLATGGTAGTYYALGGDIASLWMAKIPDLDVTAQTTGGSKDNILKINGGEAELATVQNDVMAYAYAGDKDFFDGQVVDSFVAIGALYPELVQLGVGADSDIKTVADLKGKSVSIGAIGSGVYFNAVQVLEVAGLTLDDIKPQYLSFAESSDAYQNGQIDAFFITAGLPNTAIVEADTKRPVRLLGLDDAQMEALSAKYAYYTPVNVPAGTYNGVSEDTVVPAVSAVLICAKSLDEELVYNLTKTLYADTAELSHAKKAEISAENAVKGIPVPYHSGAEKYFKEIGVLAE